MSQFDKWDDYDWKKSKTGKRGVIFTVVEFLYLQSNSSLQLMCKKDLNVTACGDKWSYRLILFSCCVHDWETEMQM